MSVLGYVILENHLHFIAVAAGPSKEVGHFKLHTARRIIDLLKQSDASTLLRQLRNEKGNHKQDREYQLWAEGSHPECIDAEEMMLQKLEYIHQNPVKRGYVDLPEHWRYSSARNYLGVPSLFLVVSGWSR